MWCTWQSYIMLQGSKLPHACRSGSANHHGWARDRHRSLPFLLAGTPPPSQLQETALQQHSRPKCTRKSHSKYLDDDSISAKWGRVVRSICCVWPNVLVLWLPPVYSGPDLLWWNNGCQAVWGHWWVLCSTVKGAREAKGACTYTLQYWLAFAMHNVYVSACTALTCSNTPAQ